MKIAIFSSASNEMLEENIIFAQNIGKYLAEKNITVVTGGCTGLPALVARVAFESGGETMAYYPDLGERELSMNAQVHNNDLSNIYTHKRFFKGFCYRSVRIIEDVDGAIVFNGRFGTLSEFTIAVEEGLNVAVIEGTGGVTDEIKRLADVIYKQFPYNHVVFSQNYKDVIAQLICSIENKKV